ncbi:MULTISPECIES: hypothetical protein [Bacillus amyloliquefaciens group]|uniref:hypothetical protein n=1 Tax=Bacillus amyloliquefaciens group TaxID=1938374 RepID=UPI001C5FFFCC|nr:hypothetical protein [Bacillus amyloliquefaciens]QYC35314.1 hypothetical protein J5X95_20615 [Bacillus amyloliquefaciens]QYC35357.1 hypothetical protein J5X95_20235 [Bacillus amyloliquefaciens]
MPGRFCTGGEELQLKERGQIRKTGQTAGATQANGVRMPGRFCTGGEELQLKERGQIRKTGQVAGATQAIGACIPAIAAPAAKNCS